MTPERIAEIERAHEDTGSWHLQDIRELCAALRDRDATIERLREAIDNRDAARVKFAKTVERERVLCIIESAMKRAIGHMVTSSVVDAVQRIREEVGK